MKLGQLFVAATTAHAFDRHDDGHADLVVQRASGTHHLADQLHEIVPDVDFGDVESHMAKTMEMLMPLPAEELTDMMYELKDFFASILDIDFLADKSN